MYCKIHLFPFFNICLGIDEMLTGWELASSLAFSESKTAANMVNAHNENRDVFITLRAMES